jgi:acetoacetyl-CoA synthetase
MTLSRTPTGTLLRPAPARSEWNQHRLGRFLEGVEARTGERFDDYEAAWRWSVENLDEFWQSVWDECGLVAHTPFSAVLGDRSMPGAEWLPGATLNYAEHIARSLAERPDAVRLLSRSQTTGSTDWTGARLLEEIGRIQRGLVALGVRAGDRVAGYIPNIPEAVAAYLAAAGLGAAWCSVPPEMGARSALDRLAQLEPTVLIAVDGYRWGTRDVSRADELARLAEGLPGTQIVFLPYLDTGAEAPAGTLAYREFTAEAAEPEFVPVPFAQPLVVLFSSGTTGKPKAIVHSHGGFLLEHSKAVHLHFGLDVTDRAFWFSTTGWMVWNLSVSTLLTGASLVIEDGDPNWPSPDGEWSQWAIAAETEATYFVTGSAYLAACAHAGLRPGATWDLSRIREIQCSGSPLSADVAGWVYAEVGQDLLLAPTSGGTDICGAFIGASPLTAVHAGEMACRPLGVAVDSWDAEGRPVREQPGELVCTQPMPSMPAFFWGDADGERYRGSYFGVYPGVWRHGDWLVGTERGTWVITGRSDATLNRGGVRLGTAEFYEALEPVPGLADTMVLHFEDDGGMGKLVLIAQTEAGVDDGAWPALEARIRSVLRTELSPRHVPDVVVRVPAVPRTATGKKLEIPLKRMVQGAEAGTAFDSGAAVGAAGLDETVGRIRAVLARA